MCPRESPTHGGFLLAVAINRILSYADSVRRGKDWPLGPPLTVRFPEELTAWLQQEAAGNPEGASGVIRDAVRAYKELQEAKKTRILEALE